MGQPITNQWNAYQQLRARGRRIVSLRAAGCSWAEIGRRLDVSRQRVYQIWQAIQAGTGPYQGLL